MSMSESDLDSPGYEYLRSYESMSNLYYKLLALNYQREFCSLYKCPPIHRYYFSLLNDNQSDQQFIYTCLCAWLIKDKCQMNLELAPEEYEDIDVTINVILEALRLLLYTSDVAQNGTVSNSNKAFVSFPAGRLKSGHGPEVIYTLNILADRALELMFERQQSNTSDSSTVGEALSPSLKRPKLVYHNKNLTNESTKKQISGSASNFITIGQPFVGGGLTTRPLGSYQIDDKSLLFDDDDSYDNQRSENSFSSSLAVDELESSSDKVALNSIVEFDDWYQQVQRASQILEAASVYSDISGSNANNSSRISFFQAAQDNNWQLFLASFSSSRKALDDFSNKFNPLLEAIASRIDRHMQVIRKREKFIQTNLVGQFDKFLQVWRLYSKELSLNNDLSEQVIQKTDLFEAHNESLKDLGLKIEERKKELNDGSKLRELQSMVDRLEEENIDFDIKINVLLNKYSRIQEKIMFEEEDEERLSRRSLVSR